MPKTCPQWHRLFECGLYMLVYMEVWAGGMTAEDPGHTDGLLTSVVAGIVT